MGLEYIQCLDKEFKLSSRSSPDDILVCSEPEISVSPDSLWKQESQMEKFTLHLHFISYFVEFRDVCENSIQIVQTFWTKMTSDSGVFKALLTRTFTSCTLKV